MKRYGLASTLLTAAFFLFSAPAVQTNDKILCNDEATPSGKNNDSDITGPKSSVKKEALKKAGAVAAGGVAAKKTKDIVAEKSKNETSGGWILDIECLIVCRVK